MKSGYKIFWTDHALIELKETFNYLENKWSEAEIKNLASKIDKTLELISSNPELFPLTEIKINIRRAVITKHNSLYYRPKNETIEVLSFFANRKNPDKKFNI